MKTALNLSVSWTPSGAMMSGQEFLEVAPVAAGSGMGHWISQPLLRDLMRPGRATHDWPLPLWVLLEKQNRTYGIPCFRAKSSISLPDNMYEMATKVLDLDYNTPNQSSTHQATHVSHLPLRHCFPYIVSSFLIFISQIYNL